MSQHSFSIPNLPGASYRASNNDALQSLVTQSAGQNEPATTYPCMVWADTANYVLRQRDETNTAWVVVESLDSNRTPLLNSTTTALLRDFGKTLLCSGSWSLGLSAAALLGAGWWCRVKNIGSGTITIDPLDSETIDGMPTWSLANRYGELTLV